MPRWCICCAVAEAELTCEHGKSRGWVDLQAFAQSLWRILCSKQARQSTRWTHLGHTILFARVGSRNVTAYSIYVMSMEWLVLVLVLVLATFHFVCFLRRLHCTVRLKLVSSRLLLRYMLNGISAANSRSSLE